MSNEPAKKPAVTPADVRHPDAPVGYDVRMSWIKLTVKDMTIGSKSMYDKVDARKESSPSGCDIFWSPSHRHYWIGTYDNNRLINSFRIVDTIVSPSSEWIG
jgi:hypothetical protein